MDWTFPYKSRRSPIFASNVVATSQPLAAQAGLEMLRRGGNAVDASVATAIALTVVEPCSNGIGSDAFAIVWDGEGLHGLNASGRSPASWSLQDFVDDGEITIGPRSITVPGAVDAWLTLSRRFGRLPFSDLFAPAIQYASGGFAISPVVQRSWSEAAVTYGGFDGFRQHFLPRGRPPAVGETFRSPDQARTLGLIAASEGEAFYQGELAAAMVDYLNQNGSVLSREDLAAHQSDWAKPIELEYTGVRVGEIPPSGQGIATLIALGILRHCGLREHLVDSVDSFHLQIEAMKIALRLVHTHVADPAHMRVTVADLLDDDELQRYADGIDRARAADWDTLIAGDGGTVYLTAADQDGMMVSFIQSNFWGFGSGIVVPGTGISLQNRAAGFSLIAGHPNALDGSKRPFHTIIPGFVMDGDHPLMSFGVMGGHMQAQGHLQMITRIFDYGQNPQAASDAPRWYVNPVGGIALEPGFFPQVAAALWQRGHHPAVDPPQFSYGGAQIIYRLDNGSYCAASDQRKDGQAVGF